MAFVRVYVYVVLCCVVWSDALPPSSVSYVWWISALPLSNVPCSGTVY